MTSGSRSGGTVECGVGRRCDSPEVYAIDDAQGVFRPRSIYPERHANVDFSTSEIDELCCWLLWVTDRVVTDEVVVVM